VARVLDAIDRSRSSRTPDARCECGPGHLHESLQLKRPPSELGRFAIPPTIHSNTTGGRSRSRLALFEGP